MKSAQRYAIGWEFCCLLGTATSLPETVIWECPVHSEASHLAVLIRGYQGTPVLPPSLIAQMDKQKKPAYFLILGVLPIIGCSDRKHDHTFLRYSLKHSGNRNS